MQFKTLTEGYTEVELENGDRIRVKVIIGNVDFALSQTEGMNAYNFQHQIVSFVTPKAKVENGKGMKK